MLSAPGLHKMIVYGYLIDLGLKILRGKKKQRITTEDKIYRSRFWRMKHLQTKDIIKIFLGMGSSSESWRSNVTSSLIGWSYTQNNPEYAWGCICKNETVIWRYLYFSKACVLTIVLMIIITEWWRAFIYLFFCQQALELNLMSYIW